MADIIFPGEEPSAVLGTTLMPKNLDLILWKGDARDFTVKFNDENGQALALAGYTPLAAMKASFNASTQYTFTTTVQNGNEVRVYLPSSISKTIPAGEYIWNLQLTAPNGDVRTYLAGDVTVLAEVDS